MAQLEPEKVDAEKWTGEIPVRSAGAPSAPFGWTEAAGLGGICLVLSGIFGAIHDGMRIGAAIMILVGAGFIVLPLRRIKHRS